MKRANFTPGPWTCVEYAKCFGVKAESGRQIAVMTEHHGDEPNTPMHQFARSAQDAADARLISAAPDLLKAIEDLMGRIFSEELAGHFKLAELNAAVEAHKKATGGAE